LGTVWCYNHPVSKEKAKENYIKKRLNCAISVSDAVKEHADLSDTDIASHASHGGGNAPNGWCGGAYAAKRALDKMGIADAAKIVENEYTKAGGSVACAALRKGKKLSCVGCVEKGAEIVLQHNKK
jgi:hypothetical protein